MSKRGEVKIISVTYDEHGVRHYKVEIDGKRSEMLSGPTLPPPPEPPGCGISWLWMLRKDHPFMPYCEWHDLQYDYRRMGALKYKSSRRVDDEFLRGLLSLSPTLTLKAQAYLFYGLARIWGKFKWPEVDKTSSAG